MNYGKTCFGESRIKIAKEMYEILYNEKRYTTCTRCGNAVEKPHTRRHVAKLFGVSIPTLMSMISDYLNSLHRSGDPEKP